MSPTPPLPTTGDHSSGTMNRSRTSARRRCVTSFHAMRRALSTTLSSRPKSHWVLLLLSIVTTMVALVASSLLPRSYYRYNLDHDSFWVISWFTSLGWPLLSIPLLPLITLTSSSPSRRLSTPFSLWYPFLGLLTAVANSIFVGIYAFPWASEWRDATDNHKSLISSFHGATTVVSAAIFGFFIAKNKVGAWGINVVVVVTIAALLVAYEFIIKEKVEGPAESFFSTLLKLDFPVSFLRGLILALTELILRKRMPPSSSASPPPLVTARVALEVQLLVSFFAFAFSCIGFFAVGGFGKMRRKGVEYEGGRKSYYMILSWSAVAFQLMEVGGTMLVGLSSTLLAGVLSSVRLPVTALVAVAFFPDAMSSYKVFGMVLAGWGLVCYGFGNLKY